MNFEAMTPNISKILAEAQDENRKEKICLIEDIMKAKRLLYGFGDIEHFEFLDPKAAGDLFYRLYDQPHAELKAIQKQYEDRINELVKKHIPA